MAGFVDVHAHVVPSGDDGAQTVEAGLVLCRLAFEAGTEVLFATPHAHAPWDTFPLVPSRQRLYDASFAEMRDPCRSWGLDLRRGLEVFPTEVAAREPESLVLQGTRAVLVEFPGSWLDMDDAIEVVTRAVDRLDEAGLVSVLAHPERCRAVAADPGCVRPLAARGALLCLNGPSLVGRHGQTAERTAWTLLDDGVISLVASDAHSHSRPPTLDAAFAEASGRLGEAAARPLFDGSALPWL
jgi:protein-tyrosine phosphatase